ncbi:MAG: sigma-54 dependent transcriptional regulator [Candidatus Acidiferrales bacterium]
MGTSEPMRRVFSTIQQVAPTSVSVLITGESGTGKERVAAAIHRLSPRAARPFVAVNCAGFPESLIESELFGHEKGAFTGAEARRAGCFELADRGTLFLDEIAEMPMQMQAKLLRVLEDSKVRRLGGQSEISVDVRVLAATNRPVKETIREKLLREDLYYRLNVVHVELPPLRHRKEDIPPLAEALIRVLNERNDCRATGLDPQTLVALMEHAWPGNVRELRNVLERAVIVAGKGAILPEHLPPSLSAVRGRQQQPPSAAPEGCFQFAEGRRLRDVEDAYIRYTLKKNNSDRVRTADALGIAVRTLSQRLDESGETDHDAASAGGRR